MSTSPLPPTSQRQKKEYTPIPNPWLNDGGEKAVTLATSFILCQVEARRANADAKNGSKEVEPLFVGFQGPQGSGKSYLTKHISTRLSSSSLSLRVAVLSLDDLYHRHSALRSLAASSPDNKLFAGRGQPGTHDLELGMECLSALKRINESGKSVKLPVFEKSLHDGQGDRSTETVDIEPPLDVVLFEGWMLGFSSLPSTSLTKLYSAASADPEKWAQENLDYTPPRFLEHKLEDLLDVNERLKAYEEGMWRNVDAFVQLEPVEMGYVWEWRLQQEHNMKAQNGGLGMTDAQVRDFIARYMPGYELFLHGIQAEDAPWRGEGLRIVLGKDREVVGHAKF